MIEMHLGEDTVKNLHDLFSGSDNGCVTLCSRDNKTLGVYTKSIYGFEVLCIPYVGGDLIPEVKVNCYVLRMILEPGIFQMEMISSGLVLIGRTGSCLVGEEREIVSITDEIESSLVKVDGQGYSLSFLEDTKNIIHLMDDRCGVDVVMFHGDVVCLEGSGVKLFKGLRSEVPWNMCLTKRGFSTVLGLVKRFPNIRFFNCDKFLVGETACGIVGIRFARESDSHSYELYRKDVPLESGLLSVPCYRQLKFMSLDKKDSISQDVVLDLEGSEILLDLPNGVKFIYPIKVNIDGYRLGLKLFYLILSLKILDQVERLSFNIYDHYISLISKDGTTILLGWESRDE